MTTITHNDLKNLIIDKIGGCSFVSMKTETDQNLLNKGSGDTSMRKVLGIDPDKIVKHAYFVGLISGAGVSYEDFVNNRLSKEAKKTGEETTIFKAGKRVWGEYLENSHNSIVTHKGELYLVVYFLANNTPQVVYTYEGKEIDPKDAKFDPYRKPAKKEGEKQGTIDPIVVRDYKFCNIKEIKVFGETYEPNPIV